MAPNQCRCDGETHVESGSGTRCRLVGATAVVLAGWLALAFGVARAEVDPLHPVRLGTILGSAVGGVGLVTVSSTWRRIVDAVPQSWLVGGQFYRVVGAVFLVGWGAGALPAFLAIPAGVGDVVTGVAAIGVAVLLVRDAASTRTVLAWNAFGFLVPISTLLHVYSVTTIVCRREASADAPDATT